MYNQVYINDFDISVYKDYLNNKLFLLETEYLKQYTDYSDAYYLALKESLDHYVLRQILKDENYINSKEFHNYMDYIKNIVKEKKQFLNGRIYNTELITNVVFRNEDVRKKIFKRHYDEATINSFENRINSTKQSINMIFRKMVNREIVSQEEIDLAGDYIYSSRNFNNNIGKIYAEYVFNEITPSSNIKASQPMLGALLSYFTQCYSIDDNVKNARIFITEFDNKSEDLAHKSGNRHYCYFSKKYFGKLSLIRDDSLNYSRIIYKNHEDADIYHLLMVAFHELTHEHQYNERNKNTSSGMACVVKNVLNNNLDEYVILDKKGNPVNISEYMVNHDSTEFEMQADEEAWRQCKSFIAEHCRNYAYKHRLVNSMSREMKCIKNEQTIRARRAISLKMDKNGNTLYYLLYDIKELKNIVKSNPRNLEIYPVLKNYMDSSGELNTSIMFSHNITSEDETGLNVDNTGLEFATYMLDFEKNKILKTIMSGKLTENQIHNLLVNIYNVMHQNVLKIRDFDKRNKNDDKAAKHHYDLKNKTDDVYNYFFKKTALESYNAIEILYFIHRYYPQIDMSTINDTKYYVSYFYELLAKTKNISLELIENICKKYDSSEAPELIELSNSMKKLYFNTNYLSDDSQDKSTGTGMKL